MRYLRKIIQVAILGAGRTIGKSCHVLRLGDILVIVDTGVDPSVEFIPGNIRLFLPMLEGENGLVGLREMLQGIRAVYIVVSHAHQDHAGGLIPIVDFIEEIAPHVTVHILGTAPTQRFNELTWMETVRAMRRKQWADTKPLFTEDDILRMRAKTTICEFGKVFEIGPEIKLMLIPAGHILGAASVCILAWGVPFVFTGDISFDDHYLVPGATSFTLPGVRFKGLICDGTYAGERGEDRGKAELRCAKGAIEVMNRGGIALYPAFQIDRAQEIVEILSRAGVPLSKIYIDGGARVM